MISINIYELNIKNMIDHYLNRGIYFISENNLTNIKVKQVRLEYSYLARNIKIIINIEKTSQAIMISTCYENICKNIDLEDSVVDELFSKISIIINSIKDSMEKNLDYNDKIIVGLPMIKDFEKYKRLFKYTNILKVKPLIKDAYNKAMSSNKDFPNYVHKLLVYGKSGLYLAELLQELQIAEYKRNFSGYEIKFIDDRVRDSNEFVDNIAFSLSLLGFVCVSMPTSLIHKLWTEE